VFKTFRSHLFSKDVKYGSDGYHGDSSGRKYTKLFSAQEPLTPVILSPKWANSVNVQ